MTKLTEQNFTNRANVVGLLSENKLKVAYNVDRRTPNGVIKDDRITGSILIETGENEVHEVSVFIYKTKADGTEAKKWAGLLTVANEYKSIKEHGREAADVVAVTNATFESERYFYNGQEGTKDKVNVNAFAGKINRTEVDPSAWGANVNLDLVVTKVRNEFKNEEETGRVIVEGYYMNVYNGNATTRGKSEFVVEEDNGADYVRERFVAGGYVTLGAKLVNIQDVKTVEIERGFGQPEIKKVYNFKRENVLIGGGTKDFDGEPIVFTKEEVAKVLADLEQKIAEQKSGNKQAAPSNNTANQGFGQGFGNQSQQTAKPTSSVDIEDPFA